MAVPTHRVTAIAEYKQPITKNNLQRFLGMAGYYQGFVPGYCNFSEKLTPATKPRASGKVQWTAEILEACISMRSALSNCWLQVYCDHGSQTTHFADDVQMNGTKDDGA